MKFSEKQKILIPISLIIIGLVILMAITNPKKGDYVDWVKEQSTVVTAKYHEKALSEFFLLGSRGVVELSNLV